MSMIDTIKAILDRITEKTGITVVTASGIDVDALAACEDALAGKPCKRVLPSYVRSYQRTTKVINYFAEGKILTEIPTNDHNLTKRCLVSSDGLMYLLLGSFEGTIYSIWLGGYTALRSDLYLTFASQKFDELEVYSAIRDGMWKVVSIKDAREYRERIFEAIQNLSKQIDLKLRGQYLINTEINPTPDLNAENNQEENSYWPTELKRGPNDTLTNAYKRENQLLRLICLHLRDERIHGMRNLPNREIAWDIINAMYDGKVDEILEIYQIAP